MKVLDEGPSGFYHEFTCKGCRARLAAEADDVSAKLFDANYGGKGYYVECPRCSTEHKLDKNKIPLTVRQRADSDNLPGDWQ